MPSRQRMQHNRQYDVVLFGASGYTGLYASEYMAAELPTDVSWAIAGRSQEKLERIAADLKMRNPDRRQPTIEICSLSDEDLSALAKKTFILITTVGPYCVYGEHAFKACAENGTHYFDVTGEVPWVRQMIEKYEDAAKASGALMFPQMGLESAPADLMTWLLASCVRQELGAKTRNVTLAIDLIRCAPSGGTIDSLFNVLDKYSAKELARSLKPYALSPVPNPNRTRHPSRCLLDRLLTRLTGLVNVPGLGLLTTSVAGRTNVAIVERSWGLLQTLPSRAGQAYGPNFSASERMRARGRLSGFATHLAITLGGLALLLLPRPLRRLLRSCLRQPGDGKGREEAAREVVELRGVASPDAPDTSKRAYCETTFRGSVYYLTAILAIQAAITVMEDYEDLHLEGGVYTAACLGQPLADRLGNAGFRMKPSIITT